MEQYSRKDFIRMAGLSAATVCGLSALSCAGVKRKDLSDAFSQAAPSLDPDIRSILELAVLSPSGHNTQPWTVRILSPRRIIIGSDRSRWLPAVDPQNRECMLSIGAFIETLVTASRICGYEAEVKVTGASALDSEIAEIRLAKGIISKENPSLIRSRRTVRKGYLPDELSSADFRQITGGDSRFTIVPPSSANGRRLAEATIDANIVQVERTAAQAELSRWIRFSDADVKRYRNGLTVEGMEIQGAAGFIVRHFYDAESVMSESFRKQTVDAVRQQVASYGGWIIISSDDESVLSLIETGRRFQRMLLGIREKGIAIHPMTQILEEKPFAQQVPAALSISGKLQFILRAGYLKSYPDPVSVRMPVDWIIKG